MTAKIDYHTGSIGQTLNIVSNLEFKAGTGTGLYANTNIEDLKRGLNHNAGLNLSNGASVSYGVDKNLSSVSYINTGNTNDVNPLRQEIKTRHMRAFIEDAIALNANSGGIAQYKDAVSIGSNANLNYQDGLNMGLGVNAKRTSGNYINNVNLEGNAGYGVNGAALGAMYSTLKGETSDKASGWVFGLDKIRGIKFDYVTVENGVRQVYPIGSVLTSLATANPIALATNIYDAFNPKKLDVPRHEVIMPDDNPRLKPDLAMFNKGESNELNPVGLKLVQEIAANYKNNPNLQLELGKYEDDINGFIRFFKDKDELNKLSAERQEVIKKELIKLGVPEDAIKIGHSELTKDSNHMSIEDNKANIRYVTDGKLILSDGATFHASRNSPVGEDRYKQIKELPKFVEKIGDKSEIEKEVVANLVYDLIYVKKIVDPKVIDDVIEKDIASEYEEGLLWSNSLKVMDNKSAINQLLTENKEFLEFIEKKNIANPKEKELLAKYVLDLTDSCHSLPLIDREGLEKSGFKPASSLSDALNQYENTILKKGLTLETFDSAIEKVEKEIQSNSTYLKIIEKAPSDEKRLLGDLLVAKWVHGNEPSEISINKNLDMLKESLYDKGLSISYLTFMQGKNSKSAYEFERNKEIAKDLQGEFFNEFKNNETIKQLAITHNMGTKRENSVEKAIEQEELLVKQHIQNVMLKNPSIKVEAAVADLIQNVYLKDSTLYKEVNPQKYVEKNIGVPHSVSAVNTAEMVNAESIKLSQEQIAVAAIKQEKEINMQTASPY